MLTVAPGVTMPWLAVARVLDIPNPEAFAAAIVMAHPVFPSVEPAYSFPWGNGHIHVDGCAAEWLPARPIGDAIQTLGRVAADLMHGRALFVSEETERSRLDACAGCDRLEGARCGACGCFIVAKVKLAASKCPLGKWL